MLKRTEHPDSMVFVTRGLVAAHGCVYTKSQYLGNDMLFDLFLSLHQVRGRRPAPTPSRPSRTNHGPPKREQR